MAKFSTMTAIGLSRVPTGGLNSPGHDRNEAFYAGSDGIISNGGGWYDDTVTNSYGYKYSLSDFLLYGWNSRWNMLCY